MSKSSPQNKNQKQKHTQNKQTEKQNKIIPWENYRDRGDLGVGRDFWRFHLGIKTTFISTRKALYREFQKEILNPTLKIDKIYVIFVHYHDNNEY